MAEFDLTGPKISAQKRPGIIWAAGGIAGLGRALELAAVHKPAIYHIEG